MIFKIKYLRWWIAGLLFLSTIINYMSRQTLSVLAPIIRDEFSLSNTDYSHLVFAFLLSYMFMQSAFGRIIDWLGTRIGMSLAIIWWSVAGVLHATAGSAVQFAVWRFMLGVGEAGNWPGSVKAIAEWFPVKERAFATGIFNSGSCIGALVAPPMVVWFAVAWNWRIAFCVTGLLGFLWLIAWLWLYRLPAHHPRITENELRYILSDNSQANYLKIENQIRWRDLFKNRNVLSLVFARMLADPVWWFYVFWLPEYFRRERNFSLIMIGYFVWIPFLTADIGNFVGGGASSYLVKRGSNPVSARKIVMIISAVLMISGIPAVRATNAYTALAMISLATFAYSCWATNILTLPSDLFKNNIASVTGLSGTGGAIGGMIFTLMTGIVVDKLSYTPVFIAAGIAPLIAALFIVTGVKNQRSSSNQVFEMAKINSVT